MADKSKSKKAAKAAPVEAKPKAAAKKAPAKNGAKPDAKKTPSAKPAAASSKTPTVPPTAKCFFSESAVPQLGPSSPTSSPRVVQFNSQAEARAHAIDYLVDFIERCEEQLWNLKREASASATE